MQLTAIEQTIVKHIHGLSFKEQQSLLDFILFLKGNIQHKENPQNKPLEEKPYLFLRNSPIILLLLFILFNIIILFFLLI